MTKNPFSAEKWGKNLDKKDKNKMTGRQQAGPVAQGAVGTQIILMYCSSLVPSYSNSEIRMSGRFEPVYFEKVVSLTIWRKGILNCATKTSFISRLTDKASCFFCF